MSIRNFANDSHFELRVPACISFLVQYQKHQDFDNIYEFGCCFDSFFNFWMILGDVQYCCLVQFWISIGFCMFCLYLWWKIGGAVGEIVRIRRILFRSELVLKPYTNHYTNIGYAFPFQTHDESLEVVIFFHRPYA